MSRTVQVYPNSHGPWCRCERCDPPPTPGQVAVGLGILGLIGLAIWAANKDR